MRIVYIAGPFRAANGWEIRQNIDRAKAAALEVWRIGAACICPHANTQDYQGVLPDAVWLEGDIEMMKRCDAVLMLPDWTRSEGASRENEAAHRAGMPVFLSLFRLKEWLDAQLQKEQISDALQARQEQARSVAPTVNLNTGHGKVTPRPDGYKEPCGGPGICPQCSREQHDDNFARANATVTASALSSGA